MQYDEVLSQAMELGKKKHPNSLQHHHASFANSVAYLVTGMSGGYGGPSMREHQASRIGHAQGQVGAFDFDDAANSVENCCYGPLTMEHAEMLEVEYCFDDAPGEQDQSQQMLATRLRN